MKSRVVPGIRFPVAVRPETTDDEVFHQIFTDKEYDIPIDFSPRFIIDGGANVGYAAIWFANKFPNALVLAFEIESTNFLALEQNVGPYPNVLPRRQALWSRSDTLEILASEFEWSGKWDFVCKKPSLDARNVVPSVSIDEVIADSPFDEIDILKLDVEGAEKEIFLNGYEKWLDKVKIIIIELHELYAPGAEEAFFSAVGRYPFKHTRSGENIVLHRMNTP